MERRERWDGTVKMNGNGNGSGLDWTRILAMPGCVSIADERQDDTRGRCGPSMQNGASRHPVIDSLLAASPYFVLLGVVVAFFLD